MIAVWGKKCAAFGRSVVGRLILVALGLIIFSTLVRTYVLADLLAADVREFAASRQLALVEQGAQHLGGKLRDRLNLLAFHAGQVGRHSFAVSPDAQAWLKAREGAAFVFPDGLALLDAADGKVLAAEPVMTAWGGDADGQDWLSLVRAGQRVVRSIRRPGDGEVVTVLAVPVAAADGRVVQVLTASIAARGRGFLGLLDRTASGKGLGDLGLVMPELGVLLTGTEARRDVTALAGLAGDKVLAKGLGGWRGSAVMDGELVSIAAVPGTQWFVIARLPDKLAFDVLQRLQGFVLRNSVLLAVVVLGVLLVLLPYLFRPLSSAAAQMRAMAEGRVPLHPLPIVRRDEIGEMVAGFNYLLERLKANEERMAHMAHHDPLTGLPNRALFEDRLDQAFLHAERQERPFALLFLDLDGFKPVNDTHGHDVGDEVLRQVAGRLRAAVRRGDTVARYGGDEFVVLLPDLDDCEQSVPALMDKLRQVVSQPYQIGGLSLRVGLSVGASVYPRDGADAVTLMGLADQEMYRVKRAHRA